MLCKYICCCLELRNDIPSNMAKLFLVDHVAQPWILAIRTKLLECWKHWNLSRESFECLHDTNHNIPTCSCINKLPSPHSTRKSDVYLSHSQLHFYVYLYFLPVITLSWRYFKVVVQTQTTIFFLLCFSNQYPHVMTLLFISLSCFRHHPEAMIQLDEVLLILLYLC